MKVDFDEINKLLQNGNLEEVSRKTGIPRRTLQDWKYRKNKWFTQAEERLTALQRYIDSQ